MSISRVSETVLSTRHESSHLTAILGDKSLEFFWLQVTETSTQLKDKTFSWLI